MIVHAPRSRLRLTEADLRFLEQALDAPDAAGEALRQLLSDSEDWPRILRLTPVVRAVLEPPGLSSVSPALLFLVLLLRLFEDAGYDEPEVADYVAGVLAANVRRADGSPRQRSKSEWIHASDFLHQIASAAGPAGAYPWQVAAGERFLLLAGMFPEFLQQREQRRGAPGLAFYEAFARQSYHAASLHPQASADRIAGVFEKLAEHLEIARGCLNRMASDYLFLSN